MFDMLWKLFALKQYFISDIAIFWNSLPDNVSSANSLLAFWQQLKHTLFQQSFPDIIM